MKTKRYENRGPANPAALRQWFNTKGAAMRNEPVLYIEKSKEGCPRLQAYNLPCENEGELPCRHFNAEVGPCPFMQGSDPDAPAGRAFTSTYARHLANQREDSRRQREKTCELLRWERGKRIQNILLSGSPVQLEKRSELAQFLGHDTEWPVGAPIISLGIS